MITPPSNSLPGVSPVSSSPSHPPEVSENGRININGKLYEIKNLTIQGKKQILGKILTPEQRNIIQELVRSALSQLTDAEGVKNFRTINIERSGTNGHVKVTKNIDRQSSSEETSSNMGDRLGLAAKTLTQASPPTSKPVERTPLSPTHARTVTNPTSKPIEKPTPDLDFTVFNRRMDRKDKIGIEEMKIAFKKALSTHFLIDKNDKQSFNALSAAFDKALDDVLKRIKEGNITSARQAKDVLVGHFASAVRDYATESGKNNLIHNDPTTDLRSLLANRGALLVYFFAQTGIESGYGPRYSSGPKEHYLK